MYKKKKNFDNNFARENKQKLNNLIIRFVIFTSEIVSAWYEKIAEAKAEKQKVAEETTELFIKRFDEIVKTNGGYFVGGRVTWADIMFMTTLEIVNPRMNRDIIEKADNLKALREKIQNSAGIKAWLAKRPVTEY